MKIDSYHTMYICLSKVLNYTVVVLIKENTGLDESLMVLLLLPQKKSWIILPPLTFSHWSHAYWDIFLYFVSLQYEGKKPCLSTVTFLGLVYITALTLDSSKPCLSPGFIPQPTETTAGLIFISQHIWGMTSRQIFHKMPVRNKSATSRATAITHRRTTSKQP